MKRHRTPSERPSPAAGWYPDPSGGSDWGYWDGSAWRRDVTAAIDRRLENRAERSSAWPMVAWSRRRWRRDLDIGAGLFLRGRALARIGEFVPRAETVECIADGTCYAWGNRRVSVVLTDLRFLLLIGSRRRADVREYPLSSISSAESGWGRLKVVVNGQKVTIYHMNPHDADDMAHALRDRLSGRRTGPAPPRRRAVGDLKKIRRWRVTEE
jgi:Protein of unknown function (DUF2510)